METKVIIRKMSQMSSVFNVRNSNNSPRGFALIAGSINPFYSNSYHFLMTKMGENEVRVHFKFIIMMKKTNVQTELSHLFSVLILRRLYCILTLCVVTERWINGNGRNEDDDWWPASSKPRPSLQKFLVLDMKWIKVSF